MRLNTLFNGKRRLFKGGVMPGHHKNTSEMAIVKMPLPTKAVLPIRQHIGAPCNPTVGVGDYVFKGDVIADSDGFVSAPIHAPTSGTIKSIGEVPSVSGDRVTAITITPDGQDRWGDNINPPQITDDNSLLQAVRNSGLVGLGGAGFPTHVKLRPPKNKTFEYLIVNAAECEPYLTVDNRIMIEATDDITYAITILKKYLNINSVIIGIEDNKPEAIKVMKDGVAKAELDNVQIGVLPSRYPQGAEKTLIYALTGRTVPEGGLPSDIGCVVMNITSLAFLGDYFRTGHPLTEKNITVDGDAISVPKNIRAIIGTPIPEITEFCGGLKAEPSKIIMGGPMMGFAIPSENHYILKNNNGLLYLTEKASQYHEPTDCIRCGRCGQVCPMSLMPKGIMDMLKFGHHNSLKKAGVLSCIECGSCAYECPAYIPLVQYMKWGKEIVRKEKK